MARTEGTGVKHWVPAQQADAAISQANPVSTTLYEVLAVTRNVRILSITTNITWGVTQPTPLEVIVTIDGIPITHSQTNPVSAVDYQATPRKQDPATAQNFSAMNATTVEEFIQVPLYEGRSVRVQVRITWAVTQPTPLVCRVKYVKW